MNRSPSQPLAATLSALFAAALLSGAGSALAQKASAPMTGASGAGMSSPSTGNKPALAAADTKFVQNAALGGMMEVELGKVAQSKGSDPQVKTFGERMVQDHGKANDELMKIASTKSIQVPTAMDKKHQADMDKLGKLSGADFDRAYMKHMVDDHKKDIAEFKKASQSAKDGDVKEFATKTLPTLQTHLQLAQAANDAVSKNKKGGAATGAASAASR